MSNAISQLTDYTAEYNSGNAIDDRHFNAEFAQIIDALNRKVKTVTTKPASGTPGDTCVNLSGVVPTLEIADASGQFVDYGNLVEPAFDIDVTGNLTFNVYINGIVTACTAITVDNGDWIKIFVQGGTVAQVDCGTNIASGSSPGANYKLIGAVYKNSAGKLGKLRKYLKNAVVGWDCVKGDDSTGHELSIYYGVTFNSCPIPLISFSGKTTTDAEEPSIINGISYYTMMIMMAFYYISKSRFIFYFHHPDSSLSSRQWFIFNFRAEGTYNA